MTNPMFNPQPNYSGVTIQIANPAVNVGTNDYARGGNYGVPQVYGGYVQPNPNLNSIPKAEQYGVTNPSQGYLNAYPAQYYLNNYNYPNNVPNSSAEPLNNGNPYGANAVNPVSAQRGFVDNNGYEVVNTNNGAVSVPQVNSYKVYADKNEPVETDFTRSNNIIGDIDDRVAEQEKEKKNTKETKIVALTDEYIKSLENYLNNPNDEIRIMASKEVLKRLDEDKDRYNDAALNALLNKMMQDPSKLVRLASLSAFSSQLASGNDYTVKLLRDIQSNPNADKEDVLQAADILLKMSAGVEIKNIPIPEKEAKKDKN